MQKIKTIIEWIPAALILIFITALFAFPMAMLFVDIGKPWWWGALLGVAVFVFICMGAKGLADTSCR